MRIAKGMRKAHKRLKTYKSMCKMRIAKGMRKAHKRLKTKGLESPDANC